MKVNFKAKIDETMNPPIYWKNLNPHAACERIKVDSQTFNILESYVKSTCCQICCSSYKLVSAERLENYRLWFRYRSKQVEMNTAVKSNEILINPMMTSPGHPKPIKSFNDSADILKDDINEFWLFHGTKDEIVPSIINEGFDERVGSSGLYGAGIYLASQACKSFSYGQNIFLARASLGEISYTNPGRTSRRAPARSNGQGTCDSVVAIVGHNEHILFDKAQAYPAYLLKFA
eukprot:GHVL01007110.1.p1 GENE.GHVL01007110.1~~GHVL01007110.1.p1  ORF type:complete len:233 (+),score=41.14 GHVL01007110.1:700-1398(+)